MTTREERQKVSSEALRKQREELGVWASKRKEHLNAIRSAETAGELGHLVAEWLEHGGWR